MTTNSPEAQPEPEFETCGTKGQMIVDAIDKAVADDPTRFTTRSFTVIENTGHSIRLVNRADARHAISVPWADLFALREVINCILKDDPRRATVAQDELRLLLRRVSELTINGEFSSNYQHGFEQFRDQMTAVLKARIAARCATGETTVEAAAPEKDYGVD